MGTAGFNGKVALVTGGSSGIGKACAARLLADGASVVIAARRPDTLETTAKELGEIGACATAVCDVADRGQIDDAVRTAVDRFGGLDILVCSHGVLPEAKPFLDLTDADWNAVLSVNLGGVISAAQAAARAMIERGAGAIVTVSSINAFQAEPEMAPYNVAKGALQALTRSMAYDLHPYGIRVNAVAPGWVLTPMTEPYFTELADADLECNIVSRVGRPEEIAALVAFLAGPDASYLAGETVTVDGGQVGILAPLRAKGT
jgi:NAD(P)-dependent dehydrogenase (short-subunit alcohol dehydrogenase family)